MRCMRKNKKLPRTHFSFRSFVCFAKKTSRAASWRREGGGTADQHSGRKDTPGCKLPGLSMPCADGPGRPRLCERASQPINKQCTRTERLPRTDTLHASALQLPPSQQKPVLRYCTLHRCTIAGRQVSCHHCRLPHLHVWWKLIYITKDCHTSICQASPARHLHHQAAPGVLNKVASMDG